MNDDSSEGTVRLHTGGVTAEPVLQVVSVALRRLREGGLNGMLAFADVVALARDDSFVLPHTSQARALGAGLVDENGRMERGIAEVVRASAAGEGYGVQVLDPITGQSP
ncbi:hypothetical protein [Streptomyces sp. MZ04]|uniref:hypothetical protein n=1 Tax=Streptomyces sp. MZ04 TaxID=2559236 RepID=UPI00107E6ABE|nr:hypothetical protein [Streptomyces sp. MZ04]TGB05593.1 hypothetical protein E2651_24800 [Streptomyces sp. MZ04]